MILPGQLLIVGAPVRVTVIVLLTDAKGLLQLSVAVHVSVIIPLQEGEDVNVEVLDVPLIKQPPLNPLLNESVDEAGIMLIQPTVIFPGAVIVGNVAGSTVIVLVCVDVLLQASVNVQVSV